MGARMGASVIAQCLRMALDIPDGPGALQGLLVLVSAFRTLSIVNIGEIGNGSSRKVVFVKPAIADVVGALRREEHRC
jgi:hypothetical protein